MHILYIYICRYTYMHMYTYVCIYVYIYESFPGGSGVKNLPADAGATGDSGSITVSGRSPQGSHGNPPQYILA